jgi:hypothetical protein
MYERAAVRISRDGRRTNKRRRTNAGIADLRPSSHYPCLVELLIHSLACQLIIRPCLGRDCLRDAKLECAKDLDIL